MDKTVNHDAIMLKLFLYFKINAISNVFKLIK